MTILLSILASTLLISLIALIGTITLILKEQFFKKLLLFFVALAAGALMGGAFLHLIPESLEKFSGFKTSSYVLLGFMLFFFIEKILHWHHCHDKECTVHTFAYMNLVGEFIHNFIDGLVIAASFVVSIPLGIATTIAVALHEIPQEIGDFGILVYGGFNKIKALVLNFIIALMVVVGGIVGYFLSYFYTENLITLLLPFAAGGFIYITASDLVPEIKKEVNLKRSLAVFGVFVLGIVIMFAMKFIGHE